MVEPSEFNKITRYVNLAVLGWLERVNETRFNIGLGFETRIAAAILLEPDNPVDANPVKPTKLAGGNDLPVLNCQRRDLTAASGARIEGQIDRADRNGQHAFR